MKDGLFKQGVGVSEPAGVAAAGFPKKDCFRAALQPLYQHILREQPDLLARSDLSFWGQ